MAWAMEYVVEEGIIWSIKVLYDGSMNSILLDSSVGKLFPSMDGLWQDCLMSLVLFNIYTWKKNHVQFIPGPSEPLCLSEGCHTVIFTLLTSIWWQAATTNYITSMTRSLPAWALMEINKVIVNTIRSTKAEIQMECIWRRCSQKMVVVLGLWQQQCR